MFPIPHHPNRHASGFSLVEIMVGMVIGMLGIIIMMQVFALSEGRRRTTTGGDDAQNNGAIALYGLQRDIRQSGYGFSDVKLLGCDVLLRAGVTLRNMAPVTINPVDPATGLASIPAGDANTDTLLVVYGNTSGSPQGDGITSQPAVASYAVQTPTSFVAGDRIIAAPQTRPAVCSLILDQVLNIATPNVVAQTGVAAMANGTLFNLGQTPKIMAYAIRIGNLTVCDYTANDCSIAGNVANAAIWVPIGSNIVSMRAQYGRDTSAVEDQIVDTYDNTQPTTACGWAKVPAVRLALVARSGQYDKATVTTVAPVWAGSAGRPINLTATFADNTEWQHYRYKTFQTVIPLRNAISMGVQAGC